MQADNNIKSLTPFPLECYKARRDKVIAQLLPNSVFIIICNPEYTRTGDTEYPHCQSSNLLYLAGFPEPQSVLILTNIAGQPQFQLLVMPKDRGQERWTGIREGVEGAKVHYGADDAHTNDKFEEVVGKLLSQAENVYYKSQRNPDFDARFTALWVGKQKPLHNPEDIVHEMRVVKGPEEIELMRKAAIVSARAHCLAMIACKPGMSEFKVQALLEFAFGWNNSVPAYPSIVAGGSNATVLHYTTNQDVLLDGNLLLVDAACERRRYASDVTRTFPINGTFNPAQRALYQVVLDMQTAGIQAARQPGATLASIHEAASKVGTAGLVRLGILPADHCDGSSHPGIQCGSAHASLAQAVKQGLVPAPGSGQMSLVATSPSDTPAPASITTYFMHYIGHRIGLDTHDTDGYLPPGGTQTDKEKAHLRVLQPGELFTVEPGIYIDVDDTRVPEQFRGLGFRIEDVVLKTTTGVEVLSKDAPKEIHEIEALMMR